MRALKAKVVKKLRLKRTRSSTDIVCPSRMGSAMEILRWIGRIKIYRTCPNLIRIWHRYRGKKVICPFSSNIE